MATSTPLSLRLPQSLSEQLTRLARLEGRTPGAMAGRLIDESLRVRANPGIYFADRVRGRSAVVMGTGLQVWEMCDLIESYDGDCRRLLVDFPHFTQRMLDSALLYKKMYREEIQAAQDHNLEIGD